MSSPNRIAAVLIALVLTCASTAVQAQERSPTPMKPAPGRTRPEAEKPDSGKPEAGKPEAGAAEGAAAKTSGLPEEISGENVAIRLHSGSTLTGVSRGERIELRRGNRYLKTDDREAIGAGIRVYYSMGLNGFIFVPYKTIADIDFLGALTGDEGALLVDGLRQAQLASVQHRTRAMEELRARQASRKAAAEEAASESKESERELADGDMEKISALLEKFPPETWKPSRIDEIRRRELIMDIMPDPTEREFLSNYDLWLIGYVEWAEARGEGETALKK